MTPGLIQMVVPSHWATRLGMSGARLITTAVYELEKTQGRYAICTMCIGVGQGIATLIERA